MVPNSNVLKTFVMILFSMTCVFLLLFSLYPYRYGWPDGIQDFDDFDEEDTNSTVSGTMDGNTTLAMFTDNIGQYPLHVTQEAKANHVRTIVPSGDKPISMSKPGNQYEMVYVLPNVRSNAKIQLSKDGPFVTIPPNGMTLLSSTNGQYWQWTPGIISSSRISTAAMETLQADKTRSA